jgi:hypothetical protein
MTRFQTSEHVGQRIGRYIPETDTDKANGTSSVWQEKDGGVRCELGNGKDREVCMPSVIAVCGVKSERKQEDGDEDGCLLPHCLLPSSSLLKRVHIANSYRLADPCSPSNTTTKLPPFHPLGSSSDRRNPPPSLASRSRESSAIAAGRRGHRSSGSRSWVGGGDR